MHREPAPNLPCQAAIRRAQFQDAFASRHFQTTPHSFLADGRTIDWIFSRGPIRPNQPEVHQSVSASDHYPLSVTFQFAL
jgi:endonuclease/exonuclease/phosphatase (EEP) superfamily protein YafD